MLDIKLYFTYGKWNLYQNFKKFQTIMNILVVSRPDYSCIHQLISRIHDFVTVFEATRFFVSNAFFQLSLSVFQLFIQLSLKCYLSLAFFIYTSCYRDTLYFAYLRLCPRIGLYMSYLCDLFFIIIFI